MNYAIFRSEPIYTLNDLAQIGSHNKREKKAYQINVSFPFNFLGGDDDIFHNLKFHIWYFIFVGEKDMSLFLHCLIAKQAKYGGAIGFFYHILCFFSSDT